jgi:hypothetical protein
MHGDFPVAEMTPEMAQFFADHGLQFRIHENREDGWLACHCISCCFGKNSVRRPFMADTFPYLEESMDGKSFGLMAGYGDTEEGAKANLLAVISGRTLYIDSGPVEILPTVQVVVPRA